MDVSTRDSFAGIWVPLITPFRADGALDLDGLAALTRRLVRAGVRGFVVCGSTGEAHMLDHDEQAQVLDTVLAACGNAAVLMGISGVTPGEVVAQVRRWRARRIIGLLVTPPHYVRPSQAGIVAFYREVAAAAAPLSIVVYDIPYRTGVTLELETLRTLAQIDNVRGLKDCGGDIAKTRALIADARLAVLAGEDAQIFATLCLGGQGAIAASAHLHPERFVALHEALAAGRLAPARALHHALAPLVAALFAEPNPAPLKAVLATLAGIAPTVRAPLQPASAAARDAALAAFAACAPSVAQAATG